MMRLGQVYARPLREDDLGRADQIMRLAFGTSIGSSKPSSFMGDADYVFTRFAAGPTAAFAAQLDGQVVGSNFATNWGSPGYPARDTRIEGEAWSG